jgi:tripartite ATP-independent transporter DctM subunit
MTMFLFVILALVLMVVGIPISFALGASSIAYMLFSGIPPVSFVQHMVRGVDSYTLLALPFFILAGQFMNNGGITRTIFRFTNSLVGHIRGGLAHANILASMIFAGISGSAVAEAGALGTVQLKSMQENGYQRDFSVGLISAAMTIGPIIPPSVIMVVYGIAAGVSIGSLFIGGIIPGIMMGVTLMLLVAWMAAKHQFPKYSDAFSLKEVWDSFKAALLALLAPILIVGGILGGIFTATEAGAIVAAYSFLIGKFYFKELTSANILRSLIETMMLSASILLIMGMSNSFAWILAYEQAPATVAHLLLGVSENPNVILLLLMLLYLILGCFMEAIAIIVMTIPVVMPVLKQVGVDPVHFGVILAVNMSLGTITPPLGIVMYVMSDIAKVSVNEFTRAVLPFFASLFALLILFTLVPQFVTLLSSLVGN